MSVITTLAPSAAKSSAMPRPIPAAAPVTMLILPSRRPISVTPFFRDGSSSDEMSAIDIERLAGDVGGGLGGEEEIGRRQIARRHHAGNRLEAQIVVDQGFRRAAGLLGDLPDGPH